MISTSKSNSDASRVIGRPPPDSSSMHMVYIDNFINMGFYRSSVRECANAGTHVLKSSGMVVHEEAESELAV